jgi:hypothetical protein
VRKEGETLLNEYQALEDERKVRLLAEMEETIFQRSTTRSRLASIANRIPVATLNPAETKVQVVRYRRTDGLVLATAAEEDSELLPGDVIDLKFVLLRNSP